MVAMVLISKFVCQIAFHFRLYTCITIIITLYQPNNMLKTTSEYQSESVTLLQYQYIDVRRKAGGHKRLRDHSSVSFFPRQVNEVDRVTLMSGSLISD